jgi:parallel beta-helix repeat protein
MFKSMSSRLLTPLLCAVVIGSIGFCPVHGETIIVESGQSIQAAIDSALLGDTVEVHAGTYTETIVVDKSITLIGVGDPVIDAEYGGDIVTVTASGCTVEGLTIIYGGWGNSGINVQSNGNTISGNTINRCGTSIKLVGVSGNTVTQNTLQYCMGHGLYLEDSDDNLITENVVTDYYSEFFDDYPIYITLSASNVIYYNIFNFGIGDFEVFVADAYDDTGSNTWYNTATLRGNQYGDYTGVDENEDGVGDTPYYIDPFGGSAIDPYPLVSEVPPAPEAPTIYSYSIDASPRAVQATVTWTTDQADSDHQIFYWSVSEYDDGQYSDWDEGTDSPSINLVGLSTDTTYYYKCYSYNGENHDYLSSSDTYSFDTWAREPTTITVDDDPGADYTTIQAAVDAAQAEDTILVYSGTYAENVVVDKLLIFETFIPETQSAPVVSGSSGYLFHLKAQGCKIDGFSFVNPELSTPAGDNAGIWVGYTQMVGPLPVTVNCGNATISNCMFDNTYYGVYVASSDEVTVSDCQFTPWGKGVYIKTGENNVVTQCTFDGLGVFLENSRNNQITDSEFNDDRGNDVITVSREGAPFNYCQGNEIRGNTFKNSCVFLNLFVTDAVVQDNIFFIESPETIQIYHAFIRVEPGCERINIQGNTITGEPYWSMGDTTGIKLYYDSDCSLTGNTVTLMSKGIQVEGCEGITMRSNDMHDNIHNFYYVPVRSFPEVPARYFKNDIDTSNTVNGKEIHYIVGQTGLTIDPATYPDIGMLILVNCSDIIVQNQLFQSNSYGLLLYNTNSSTVEGVTCNWNHRAGVALFRSESVTIDECTLNNNGYDISSWAIDLGIDDICTGLYLYRAQELAVTGCTIKNNDRRGIDAWYVADSTFTGNTIEDNGLDHEEYPVVYGIYFEHGYGVHMSFYSTQNTFHTNTIRSTLDNSQKYGIFTYYYNSDDNLFYNNYLDNGINAYDNGLAQTWNIGKTLGTNIISGAYLGGNYWSDYELVGGDNDHDGLGDVEVPWTSGGRILSGDSHPLTNVVLLDTVAPTMVITSPLDGRTYSSGTVQLRVSSPDPDVAAWWYNLNGGPDVPFTPNTVITGLTDGDYALVVHVKDTSDNENQEIIDFSVRISTSGGGYYVPEPPLPEVPPEESMFTIAITSPRPTSYSDRILTLTYTSPRPLSRVSCVVDGAAPVNLNTGSFTLSRLTIGEHTVVVSGEDYYGEKGRGEVTFNVVPLTFEGDTHTKSDDHPDEVTYSFIARPTNYTLSFKARSLSRGEVELYINAYLTGVMGESPAVGSLYGNVTLLGPLEPASTWREYNYTVDMKRLVPDAVNYIGFIHSSNPDRLSEFNAWEVKDVVLTPVSLSNIPMVQVASSEKALSLRDELHPIIMIDGVDDPNLFDSYLYIIDPDGQTHYYPEWGTEATPLDPKLLQVNYYGQLSRPYVFGPAMKPGAYSLVAKITSRGQSSPLALSMSRVYYGNASSVRLFINKETLTNGDTILVDAAVTPPLNATDGSLVVQIEDPAGRVMYLPGMSASLVRVQFSPIECLYQNMLESTIMGSWPNGTYILRARLYDAEGDPVADDTQIFTVSREQVKLKGVITFLTSAQITSKNLRLLDTRTLRTVASLSEGEGNAYSLSAPPGQYFLTGEVEVSFYSGDSATWQGGYVYNIPLTRVGLYPGEDTTYNIKLYSSLGRMTTSTTVAYWGQGYVITPAFLDSSKPSPRLVTVEDSTSSLSTPSIYASVTLSDTVISELLAENPGDSEATAKRFYSLKVQSMIKGQSTDVKVSSYGEIQDAMNQQEQMLLEGQITEVNMDVFAGINGEYMVAISLYKLGERYLASAVLYDLDLVTVVARTSNEATTLDQALNGAVSALGDLGAFIRQWEVTHPVPPRNPTLIGQATPDNVSPEEDQNKATLAISVTNCWDEPVNGAKIYFKEVTERGYVKGASGQGAYYGYIYATTDQSGSASTEYTLNKGMQAGQDQVDYLVEARGRRTVKASTLIKVNGLAIDVKAVNTTVAPYETTTIHVDVYRIDKDGKRTPREGAPILIEKTSLRDCKVIPLGSLNADGMPITDANGRASFRFIAGEKEGVVDVPARYQALGYEDSVRGVASIEVKAEKYLITVRWTESVDMWKQEGDYGLLSTVGQGCRLDGYEWIGRYVFNMKAEVLWDARSGREETDVTISYRKEFEYEHITHAWWPQPLGIIETEHGPMLDYTGAHSVTITKSKGKVDCNSDLDNKITIKTKLKKDAAGNLYVYLNPIRVDVPVYGSYQSHVDTSYFEEWLTDTYVTEDGYVRYIYSTVDTDSSSADYSHTYDGTTYRPSPGYYADQVAMTGNPYYKYIYPAVFPGGGFVPVPILAKTGSSYSSYKQSFHVDYSNRLYLSGGSYLLPGEYESVCHGPDEFYWSRYEQVMNRMELVKHEAGYKYYPDWVIDREFALTVMRK